MARSPQKRITCLNQKTGKSDFFMNLGLALCVDPAHALDITEKLDQQHARTRVKRAQFGKKRTRTFRDQ